MFRNEVLLQETIKGRMKDKAFRGRKRLVMLSELASSPVYLEVQRAAEDREGWRVVNRRRMP